MPSFKHSQTLQASIAAKLSEMQAHVEMNDITAMLLGVLLYSGDGQIVSRHHKHQGNI